MTAVLSPLRLAVLSLARRRVTTVITALSIAMAVACSGILLRLYFLSTSRFDSLGSGWEAVVGAKAGGIEILLNSLNAEGPYPDFLPYALYESLHAGQAVHFEDGVNAEPKYIQNISPLLYFAKLGESRVAGSDENFARTIGGLAQGAWAAAESEIVVGDAIARRENVRVGDTVKVQAWVGEHLGEDQLPFKVVGILKQTKSIFDQMLFSNVAQAQKVILENRSFVGERTIWGERVLNYFLLNLHPGGFAKLANLVNKRTVGQAVLVEVEKRRLEELTGTGKNLGLFISVFVILLSSLAVSAMLITRFEAMGVQLAVLRALGYGRSEIGRWLLWEGFLLGVFGCLLGALIDAAAFPLIRQLLGSAVPLAQSSVLQSFPVWLLALVATVSAIFIPLIRLYQQDVHRALKG